MVVQVLVREVMTREVVTVTPETTMSDAVSRLQRAGVGSLVVTADDAVVGILTDGDFLDVLSSKRHPTTQLVSKHMTSPVHTIAESADIIDAATQLKDHRIDQLPVLEGDRLVGLISVAELAAYLPQCVLKPTDGQREGPHTDWIAEFDDTGTTGISVGDTVHFSKTVSEADVEMFAKISGDQNPLHLDETFAEQTRFKRRIAHGLLTASLFSAALAHLPGLIIYLSQNIRFLGPVEIGERVSVVCEVIQNLGNDRFRLTTEGYDEEGAQVLLGEATVLVDPLPKDSTESESVPVRAS